MRGSGSPGALHGFRVGVTSDRRSEDLISALERRGADVLHAPALRMSPNDHDDRLLAETESVIALRPDVVLVTTGYGMRRWFEVADAAGLSTGLTAALDHAQVLARGPKALGAIRAAGLEDVTAFQHESTASMVDDLLASGRPAAKVVVQLHGYTDEVQLRRLADAGHQVHTVTPYRWAPSPAEGDLSRLVQAACTRQLDAVTFTSAPGADAVLSEAGRAGRLLELVDALRADVLAVAVGPVTASPLVDAGVAPAVPERYRLGAMIRLVCDRLGSDHLIRFATDAGELELRGRVVRLGDREILLSPTSKALLLRLARADGVVGRRALVDCLWDVSDDHALEVAISRLRQTLGVPGLVKTVVKRGYLLDGERIPSTGEAGCRR